MSERLCAYCINPPECQFRLSAEAVVFAVFDGVKTPEEAHDAIAVFRLMARGRSCPNLNDVNLYYPGIEKQ